MAEDERKCMNCGRLLPDDAIFCPECGETVFHNRIITSPVEGGFKPVGHVDEIPETKKKQAIFRKRRRE